MQKNAVENLVLKRNPWLTYLHDKYFYRPFIKVARISHDHQYFYAMETAAVRPDQLTTNPNNLARATLKVEWAIILSLSQGLTGPFLTTTRLASLDQLIDIGGHFRPPIFSNSNSKSHFLLLYKWLYEWTFFLSDACIYHYAVLTAAYTLVK